MAELTVLFGSTRILGSVGEAAHSVRPDRIELFSLSTGERIQLIENAHYKDGLPLGPSPSPRPEWNWLLGSGHQQRGDDNNQPITLPVLILAAHCSSSITCSNESYRPA